MKYNKVLLIQARYDSTFSNVLPTGIGYLSESLTANGIDNEVFDLNLENESKRNLFKKISEYKPDLAAFSMMTLNYRYNYYVMREIKQSFKGLTVITGGPHASTMREKVLEDAPWIDLACVMEGEKAIVELCQGLELPSIKGLIYRGVNGKVIYTGDREFIADLDEIPFPKYEKFRKDNYSSLISIISSRGCPYSCIYCPVSLAIGKKLRFRSAKNIVDEIEYHYKNGYREFSFRDDNFTFKEEHVHNICDEIDRRGLKGLYLMCDNGIRADKVNENLLQRMWRSGFRMLGFGIESGSQKVLDAVRKSEKVEDMKRAVKTACEFGYKVELFFLIGSPSETWDDFMESVKFATEFPVSIVNFYQLLPYPGTELFEYVRRNGRFLREPEVYLNDGSQRKNTPFFETKEMPYALRKKAYDLAYKAVKESPVIKAARRRNYEDNIRSVLSEKGVKGKVQDIITGIYCNGFMHDKIFNNAFCGKLKKALLKR